MKNNTELVETAFQDMLARNRVTPNDLMHMDQGSTYASELYQDMLRKHQIICSMSRKGNCWDNAAMESFWGKMKGEWLRDDYATIEEAMADVYEYVWDFHTHQRPHASLGYLTPAEYCKKYSVAEH